MCETRDLGMKSPQWHTLIIEGQEQVDLGDVCPKDGKKLLLKQARTTFWKNWAAKHFYEQLKEVFGWSRHWLCCKGGRRSGLTNVVMSQESWFW